MTLPLTEEEKKEHRKAQLRKAQRRFYDAHKRKKEKGEAPKTYNVEHLRAYHKTYYQRNRERILQRAKEQYQTKKQTINSDDTP